MRNPKLAGLVNPPRKRFDAGSRIRMRFEPKPSKTSDKDSESGFGLVINERTKGEDDSVNFHMKKRKWEP
jgi:hypothetical protein